MTSNGQRWLEKKTTASLAPTGSILLLVLVSIIIMTLTTSSFLLLMRGEHLAARYRGNHLQTESFVQSGQAFLQVLLNQSYSDLEQQGGLYDNPSLLQDVLVTDEQMVLDRGYFTVVTPNLGQDGYYSDLRHGLENESNKLNLNTLLENEEISLPSGETIEARDRLLAIPGITEEIADAILDWLDDDDEPRANGAESTYYQNLSKAYEPRNDSLTHLDELLMVRGITPELLYGIDANRNYLVGAGELPRGVLEQLDNTNNQLDRGLSAYLTVRSLEGSKTTDGEPKINLNDTDLQALHGQLQQALGTAEANFIIAFRQFGAAGQGATGTSTNASAVAIDFTREAQSSVESLLDLIDARVSIQVSSGGSGGNSPPPDLVEPVWTNNQATFRQAFNELQDVVTVDQGNSAAGRININQASRPVLLAIPGMNESLADQILANRDPETDLVDDERRHPTWLVAEGLVSLEDFRLMAPYITTGGDVFSGQIVGYFESGTAQARAEVMLNRSGEEAELIEWQNLSRLGPGFLRSKISDLIEESP